MSPQGIARLIGVAILIFVIIVMASSGTYVVHPGFRGVEVTMGKVSPVFKPEGFGFKTPLITAVHPVSVRQQTDEEKAAAARFLRFFCEAEQAAYLSTRTGYLPITTPAVDRMRTEGFFVKHPNDAVAQAQLASVDPWPWEPLLLRIERDIVDPRLEEAVLLDRDAASVLAEARMLAARPG